MRYSIAQLARRTRNIRRKSVILREVAAPAMLATDLYQSVYKPIVDIWAQAAPSVVAEYARTLSAMTQDSPADVQREIESAESAATRLFISITPSLRSFALRVERSIRTKWRGAVLSAVGVDLETMLGPEDVRETLQSYIAWNTDLIADVSGEIKKRVSDRVYSGLSEGRPAREVAKEIDEAVGLGRKRSQRIANHQLSSISSSLAAERRREAGLNSFVWHHSAKLHPRQEHLVRDGAYYTEDAANVGKKVDGKTLRAAPERGDRAGIKPGCGCRERALLIFEFDEEP